MPSIWPAISDHSSTTGTSRIWPGSRQPVPRIEAGLAAGVYDEAALESKFNAVDHNGDGLICFQDFFAIARERPNPASLLQFNYNVVDNNASAP
jgi:hypothetical protein